MRPWSYLIGLIALFSATFGLVTYLAIQFDRHTLCLILPSDVRASIQREAEERHGTAAEVVTSLIRDAQVRPVVIEMPCASQGGDGPR